MQQVKDGIGDGHGSIHFKAVHFAVGDENVGDHLSPYFNRNSNIVDDEIVEDVDEAEGDREADDLLVDPNASSRAVGLIQEANALHKR